MRKVFPIILLSLLFFSLTVSLVQGDVGEHDKDWCKDIPIEKRVGGLVPCGRSCNDPKTDGIDESEPCTLCHFFIMIDIWIKGLLFMIVPPLAVLMIAIGGWMYFFSQGNPEKIAQAKKLFTAVAFGLLIIYGAWLIVNTFLMTIGVAEWTNLKEGWWIISCD